VTLLAWTERTMTRLRVDSRPSGSPPSLGRVAVVSVLSILISLAADLALVKWATSAFPATTNYAHFRFVDYGTLTIVGVAAACAAWFVITRVTSSARWLFLRLAVTVMLALWIPDLYLFAKGEPTSAVFFLMLMHLVIALVTYNALVRVAPVRDNGVTRESLMIASGDRRVISRRAWTTMMLLVGAEMLVGFAELLSVPFDRPNGWVISQGEAVTIVHGVLGGFLGFGALIIFALASREGRVERIAATVGLIGVGIGGIGGFFCYAHSLRLVGMVLMFLGAATAFFGYLMPTIDDAPDTSQFLPPSSPSTSP